MTTNTLASYTAFASRIAGRQGYWNAVCDCHNTNVKVSLADFTKVAYLLQVDPSTVEGITAINHDIFRRAGRA